MVKGLITGLGNKLATGDYRDTTDEGALRVEGAAVLVNTTGTTQYAFERGAGSVADGTATGSTTAISFATAFGTTPNFVANYHLKGFAATAGSDGLNLAGVATGSAVVVGASGAGFSWIAIGEKA